MAGTFGSVPSDEDLPTGEAHTCRRPGEMTAGIVNAHTRAEQESIRRDHRPASSRSSRKLDEAIRDALDQKWDTPDARSLALDLTAVLVAGVEALAAPPVIGASPSSTASMSPRKRAGRPDTT